MKLKYIALFLIILMSKLHAIEECEQCCRGKVDVGPAFVRVDILESNKTVKRLDMLALKADSTIVFNKCCGLSLKPTLLYGKGNHGELFSGGGGIGMCAPFWNCWTITPSVGCVYTHLSAKIAASKFGIPPFLATSIKEIFHSVSPYVAVDVTYTFSPGWRICGMYQYSWSKTNTQLKGLPEMLKGQSPFKSHSKGPNYALMIEHDINQSWSIQLGAAYNISLSKEKHGLRGMGAKVAVAYWF